MCCAVIRRLKIETADNRYKWCSVASARAASAVAPVAGFSALIATLPAALVLDGALGFILKWCVSRLRKAGRCSGDSHGAGDNCSCDSTTTVAVVVARALLLGE